MGKIINDNSKWGDKFIETLEKELRLDFPNIKGFSARNLQRMKKFYLEYKDEEILPPAVAKLPWTHNTILIEKIKDKDIRKIYIENTIKNGWSRNVLAMQIESGFHRRIRNSNNNFDIFYHQRGVSSYEVEKYIPKDILEKLPTEEDINLYIDLEKSDKNE